MACSRPPQEFVLVPGTQFCYVPNEYDKNKYAQCNYVSHRTLMRCKQIRAKDDLAKHSGICDEHEELARHLKANFNKELHRIKSECDNPNSMRNRFESFIISNDYVSDEDEWMQHGSTISNEFPDQIFESFIDDDPLRHAGYFTEKDILRIKLRKYTRDLEDLKAFRDLLEAQASKINEKIDWSSKSVQLDFSMQRAYETSNRYGTKDYLKASKNTSVPDGPICIYGNDKDDVFAINDIMNAIIEDVDEKIEYFIKTPCTKSAIFKSQYCIDHIILDNKQQIFGQCSVCGDIAVAVHDPICTLHRKEFVNIRANHPNHNVRPGDEKIKNTSAEFYTENRVKKVLIDESDEEEKVGKQDLSNIESTSLIDRNLKCEPPNIMRSSQNGTELSAAQKFVANMVKNRGIEVLGGAKSANKQQSADENVPTKGKVIPTPRLLPSLNIRSNYTSTPPSYQTHSRPQKCFKPQNGHTSSNQPKQIPLERLPESDEKSNEHVQYTRFERDVPRGVPYIPHPINSSRISHNNSAFYRPSFVTPQRHSSNMVSMTQQSRIPIPPHRMLAMGAASVADKSKPRSFFDVAVQRKKQQLKQRHQQDRSERRIFDPPTEQVASLATSAVPAVNTSGPWNKYSSKPDVPSSRNYIVVAKSGNFSSIDTSIISAQQNFAHMDVKTFLEMSGAKQRFKGQKKDFQYFEKQGGPFSYLSSKLPSQRKPQESIPQAVSTLPQEISFKKIAPNETLNIVKETDEVKEEEKELENICKKTKVDRTTTSASSAESQEKESSAKILITRVSSEKEESSKRKASDLVKSTDEPTTKKALPTSTRIPRAAAIAANQAISHTKTSTSIPRSSMRKEMPTFLNLKSMNPLDVLAAVSEIEEKKERLKSIGNTSTNPSSKEKHNVSASKPPPRRSTRRK